MPMGKGTYGSQKGRPADKDKQAMLAKLKRDPDIRKLAMKKMRAMQKKKA